MQKSSLLKISAIVILIIGIVSLISTIAQLLSPAMQLATAGAEAYGVGGVMSAIKFIAIVVCILYVLAGLAGLLGKSKGLCLGLGIVVLILSILSLLGGFTIWTILGLVFSITYVVGTAQSQKA